MSHGSKNHRLPGPGSVYPGRVFKGTSLPEEWERYYYPECRLVKIIPDRNLSKCGTEVKVAFFAYSTL